MAMPINVSDLINRRVIKNARIEYKGDWNPVHKRFLLPGINAVPGKRQRRSLAEGVVQYSEPEKICSRNQKICLVKGIRNE